MTCYYFSIILGLENTGLGRHEGGQAALDKKKIKKPCGSVMDQPGFGCAQCYAASVMAK